MRLLSTQINIDADVGVRYDPLMFVIDQENSICYQMQHTDEPGTWFDSLEGLGHIATERAWSKEDVTAIWNGFAGTAGPFGDLKPVKQMRNRPYGLKRIWEAIQRLVPADAASEPVAPVVDTVEVPKKVTRKKNTKIAKAAKTVTKRTAKVKKAVVTEVQKSTKRDDVVKLISRKHGASLAEISEKMGYKFHTIRGMISTLGSKHGLTIESFKDKTKGRCYRLVA